MFRPGRLIVCPKCNATLTMPYKRYFINGLVFLALVMGFAWLSVDFFPDQNIYFVVFYLIAYQTLIAMFTPLIKK